MKQQFTDFTYKRNRPRYVPITRSNVSFRTLCLRAYQQLSYHAMAKATLKTTKTDSDVAEFLDTCSAEVRADCLELVAMMQQVTGAPPKLWGPSIVGFGDQHLVYDSGRELDWFLVGFAPRKGKLVLYLPTGAPAFPDLLARLGKHSTGVSCLYVSKLAAVDRTVLTELVAASVQAVSSKGRR